MHRALGRALYDLGVRYRDKRHSMSAPQQTDAIQARARDRTTAEVEHPPVSLRDTVDVPVPRSVSASGRYLCLSDEEIADDSDAPPRSTWIQRFVLGLIVVGALALAGYAWTRSADASDGSRPQHSAQKR